MSGGGHFSAFFPALCHPGDVSPFILHKFAGIQRNLIAAYATLSRRSRSAGRVSFAPARPKEVPVNSHLSNNILNSLPPPLHSFRAKLTAVPLPVGMPIYEPHEIPKFAHFLTSGIASVVTTMKDGGSVETGMWAREGVACARRQQACAQPLFYADCRHRDAHVVCRPGT